MDPPHFSNFGSLACGCASARGLRLCLFQNQQNQPKTIRIGENWRKIIMKGVCLIRTPPSGGGLIWTPPSVWAENQRKSTCWLDLDPGPKQTQGW